MICSFICCSRQNPASLLRAVISIYATAKHPDQVEVLIRIDDDDRETLNALRDGLAQTFRELSQHIHITVGKRENGYASLQDFTIRLLPSVKGDWLCMWNDDAVMEPASEAEPWDEQLASLPLDRYVVQPSVYKLGASEYPYCERSAFPFFPNKSWEKYGLEFWPKPADYQVDEILRVQNGWETRYLEGITIFHDRNEDRLK